MIRAAAAHAESPGKNPPPPELTLALQCDRWGTLPETGGVRDQRIGELDRMAIVLNIYRAVKGYRDAQGKKGKKSWRNANPQAYQIYLDVLDMKYGEE